MSYSEHMPFVLTPAEGADGVDLKSAAGTIAGTFIIPVGYGTIRILKMGMRAKGAGGAQTTAGTLALYIAGTSWKAQDGSTVQTIASVASHADNAGVEDDLNQTTTSTSDTENTYNTAPQYPEPTDGQLVELRVETQGVGAGAQDYYPYIVAQRVLT